MCLESMYLELPVVLQAKLRGKRRQLQLLIWKWLWEAMQHGKAEDVGTSAMLLCGGNCDGTLQGLQPSHSKLRSQLTEVACLSLLNVNKNLSKRDQ